ncbi:MAG: DMT family transporter [Aphanothece sp. CMT-3BRIN-NPC111]|nr:DMT family transporter [Aphanothece sp. CMT-3BRIN-NPC111]
MPLHQTSGRWRIGLALSLVTVFMWGVEPIALTVALQALDVYTLTWFRFLVCFGLLGVYLAVRRQLPTPEKLRSTSLGLFAIAIIFLAINYVLFLKGLAQTSPSSGEVLIQLAPVLMGLGALAIFKERYTRRQVAGLGVLTLGFTFFFHDKLQTLIQAPTQYLIGSSLIVVSAAAWAVYALAQKQLLQKLPSTNIMLIVYGVCAIIFSFFADPQVILKLSPVQLGILIFCAFDSLIAYGAFAEALDHWEASKISAVLPLSPLVTLISMQALQLLAPTLIAPERTTALGFLGAGLVVAGSMAIAVGKKDEVGDR